MLCYFTTRSQCASNTPSKLRRELASLIRSTVAGSVALVGAIAAFEPNVSLSAEPSQQLLEKALSFRPRQADVNFENVPEAERSDCSIEELTRPDGKGFMITGPAGQPLRWFVDTNKDNRLDQWCYYNAGVEIYREIDTDFNDTADEFRWLNTEGLRWGTDADEDGTIDRWTMISAEEVTAEAVRAAAERDEKRFARLLITSEEIEALGLGEEKQERLLQRVKDASEQFKSWSTGQNVVTRNSRWTNFGADKPGIVPAGTNGSAKDIVVYENAVALLEDDKSPKQLLVGTMIQVGSVWRLVDLPKAVSEGAVVDNSGFFFAASFTPKSAAANLPASNGGISKVMEKLIEELQQVDSKLVASGGDTEGLQAKRADVLEKLVSAAESPADRTTWIQQFADTVSAAAQTNEFPGGVARLKDFMERLESTEATPDEIAYVAFRTLTADYNYQMMQPKAEYEKLQEGYLEDLRDYVASYPKSKDSAEAMIQIALSAEFTGETKEAAKWYATAAKNFADTLPGQKANGALRRLSIADKPFNIRGNTLDGNTFASDSYKGGPVIYHCWASWCEGCKAEMRALKELQTKYAKNKVRIVGINLDNDASQGMEFLKENPFPWVHLYDKGGLDSTLAVGYGILTLPANFVVDKEGKVVASGVHWTELDSVISDLIK